MSAGLLHGLAAALALSDVVLAFLCFVLFARPEALLGLLAGLSGRRVAWREGRLTEADEDALFDLAARLRGPLLAALFGWSFVCGAVVTVSRL